MWSTWTDSKAATGPTIYHPLDARTKHSTKMAMTVDTFENRVGGG